jgi:dTDP-4-dehydrorhamnose reductase
MRILILGVSGMLGYTLFKHFRQRDHLLVSGTVRRMGSVARILSDSEISCIVNDVDADNLSSVYSACRIKKPDVIINCIGIIKQLKDAGDPISCISINALFPHRLAKIAQEIGARVIHISTDCVFDGKRGGYTEFDESNAHDLYGKTKFLGELSSCSHAITLRTSIIGHELNKSLSLIDWFLDQAGPVRGYRRALYSGLPTVELANVILRYVLPRSDLHGLYHVSSEPINKYDLLGLVAAAYGKRAGIQPNDDFILDRSMDSTRFRSATGYAPPSWLALVQCMHQDFLANHSHRKFS